MNCYILKDLDKSLCTDLHKDLQLECHTPSICRITLSDLICKSERMSIQYLRPSFAPSLPPTVSWIHCRYKTWDANSQKNH